MQLLRPLLCMPTAEGWSGQGKGESVGMQPLAGLPSAPFHPSGVGMHNSGCSSCVPIAAHYPPPSRGGHD